MEKGHADGAADTKSVANSEHLDPWMAGSVIPFSITYFSIGHIFHVRSHCRPSVHMLGDCRRNVR